MNKSQKIKIVSFAKYLETVRELREQHERLKSLFENQRRNAEKVNETDTWTGRAQRAMYEKYLELNGNYAPIEYSMGVFIDFLRKTADDYMLINQAIERNIDSFIESLDVNS